MVISDFSFLDMSRLSLSVSSLIYMHRVIVNKTFSCNLIQTNGKL